MPCFFFFLFSNVCFLIFDFHNNATCPNGVPPSHQCFGCSIPNLLETSPTFLRSQWYRRHLCQIPRLNFAIDRWWSPNDIERRQFQTLKNQSHPYLPRPWHETNLLNCWRWCHRSFDHFVRHRSRLWSQWTRCFYGGGQKLLWFVFAMHNDDGGHGPRVTCIFSPNQTFLVRVLRTNLVCHLWQRATHEIVAICPRWVCWEVHRLLNFATYDLFPRVTWHVRFWNLNDGGAIANYHCRPKEWDDQNNPER